MPISIFYHQPQNLAPSTMASLRSIKDKIRSVQKTHQVTKAMEAVSGVKMRKAQVSALVARPYAISAFRILSRIVGSIDITRHPLVIKIEVKKVLLVVITSDKGLAGGLNSGVTKTALATLANRGVAHENTGVIAIGRKGEEFFSRRGYLLEDHIETMKDESTIGDFSRVVSLVTDLFTRGKYEECILVYTNFRSTFEQEPLARTLLPLSVDGLRAMMEGITPVIGKFSEVNANFKKEEQLDQDVKALMDQMEREHEGQFQRHKMFPMLKQKLAKERKFIL